MKKRKDEPPARRDNDGLHRRRGTWYYALRVDGKRRFFSTKTKNINDARGVRAAAVKAQIENRLPTDAAKWRFEVLLAKVLEDRKPHLAEGTVKLERERSGPLLKHFSGRRVCEISNDVIRSFQSKRAKVVGNRTINLECKVLRTILKAARVWGTLADDFKPLKEDTRGPGRALTDEQERVLFETAASKPEWNTAYLAALAASNTSARSCELKGLRLADVNLVDREVSIRRSKTDTGIRQIPLNDGALWAFARLLERAGALGCVDPEHYLLPRFRYRETKTAGHGTGYDCTRPMKTWRTGWRSLVKAAARRAGREAAREAVQAGRGWRAARSAWKRAAAPLTGLRFHDLRHTCITKLAEGAASDQTIMALAGHLDRSMLEHYSHARAAAKRKAIDGITSWVPPELREAPAATEKVQ